MTFLEINNLAKREKKPRKIIIKHLNSSYHITSQKIFYEGKKEAKFEP